MFNELTHYHRVLFAYIGCQLQKALQFFHVGTDVHGRPAQYITGSDQDGETYLLYKKLNVFERAQFFPTGLIYPDAVEHGRELVSVFGLIDAFGRGAQDGDMLFVQPQGQIVGNLSSGGNDNSFGIFEFQNIHYSFKTQFVEIQAVAHIVIGRYGFGIVIDHHRAPAFFADGV